MGGSNSHGNGSGSGSGGTNDCGQQIDFQVSIFNGQEEVVWDECKINQLIDLEIDFGDSIPAMLIKRKPDGFIIGSVPASYSWVLKCITDEGWKYSGKIRKIEGTEYNPKIFILLNAVKI